MKRVLCLLLTVAAIAGILPATLAVPIDAEVRDTPRQDVLENLPPWHELGVGFPDCEEITASDEEDPYVPCPNDYENGTNYKITIQNMGQCYWSNLVYVADPETTFSNDDGEAQDLKAPGWTLAFKIDNVGANTPLVYESMTQDNIFEPGEVWEFVVQDYNNTLGLAPSLLDSWDGVNQGQIAHASAGGPPSSASIIAIPEPNVIVMVLMSGGGLLFVRRSFMI
jgi:hypothetical protein